MARHNSIFSQLGVSERAKPHACLRIMPPAAHKIVKKKKKKNCTESENTVVGEAEYKRSVTINYLSLWQNVGCRSARLERVANDRPISDVMARVHPSHWTLNDSVNRFDTSHVTLQWQPHPLQRHTKFLCNSPDTTTTLSTSLIL
jgi:hypothetical protein